MTEPSTPEDEPVAERSDAPPPDADPPQKRRRTRRRFSTGELAIDKLVDFILIFVGLYAATAVQRCQDSQKEEEAYVRLLRDFKTELAANLEQEASITKDIGAIEDSAPGKNLGPMGHTFDDFFRALDEDDAVIRCLHVEFATDGPGLVPKKDPAFLADCHARYAKFEKGHGGSTEPFVFRPTVLTPFYHYEVWQLYLADGVKTFKNKELAVKLGELYANARLVERYVADVESAFNDTFMVQVGRSAATDAELAELVHDEEEVHGLSPHNQAALVQLLHAVKEERFAAKEAKAVVELKVERMKKTVLLLRAEIQAMQTAIDEEIARTAR
jgi:hypothetical protein